MIKQCIWSMIWVDLVRSNVHPLNINKPIFEMYFLLHSHFLSELFVDYSLMRLYAKFKSRRLLYMLSYF